MKTMRIRILLMTLSLCLLLPLAGCSPELPEEEETPYYASVVTRDEPRGDATEPEVSSEGDGASTHDETVALGDELSEIDRLREDYNLGTCKSLSGDVAVVLFYMNDFESQWTKEEMDRFTQNEVKPALSFLEQEAARYGVELTLTVKKVYSSIQYDDEVIQSVKDTGYCTSDVLFQAAWRINFTSTEKMLKSFRNRYITDEVICLTIFNKDGTSYALNPKRGADISMDEHCLVFARDLDAETNGTDGSQVSIIARVMLYLYGAESFSAIETRKSIATFHYPDDLMLYAAYDVRANTIGPATAFYVGWTDTPPDVLYLEGW